MPCHRERLRRFRHPKLRLQQQTASISCEIEQTPPRQTLAPNELLWQPSRATKQTHLGITTPGSCSQAPQNQRKSHVFHETPWATFHQPDEKARLTLISTLPPHLLTSLALPHPTTQSYHLSAKIRLNAPAALDAPQTQHPATSLPTSPGPVAWEP